jgi:hypothetical protein
MLLVAGTAFGQTARRREVNKQADDLKEQIELISKPDSFKTESYEANGDLYKIRVYRLWLYVPAKAASKGVKARAAATVPTNYRIEVLYHIATSQRREAQTEAVMLGADLLEATAINREALEISADLTGKVTEATIRYYAGTKLLASGDTLTDSTGQLSSAVDRMRKLDAWARLNADKN